MEMKIPKTFRLFHLVTFTSKTADDPTPAMVSIVRLQEAERSTGAWRQPVILRLTHNQMEVIDEATNDLMEQFSVLAIRRPQTFDGHNKEYSNLILFTVITGNCSSELHIFKCQGQLRAKTVVDSINWWKMRIWEIPKTAKIMELLRNTEDSYRKQHQEQEQIKQQKQPPKQQKQQQLQQEQQQQQLVRQLQQQQQQQQQQKQQHLVRQLQQQQQQHHQQCLVKQMKQTVKCGEKENYLQPEAKIQSQIQGKKSPPEIKNNSNERRHKLQQQQHVVVVEKHNCNNSSNRSDKQPAKIQAINSNVKETVNIFNQLALQRKKYFKSMDSVRSGDEPRKKTTGLVREAEDSTIQIKPKKLQPFSYF